MKQKINKIYKGDKRNLAQKADYTQHDKNHKGGKKQWDGEK